ncbi:MAG: hypothetical protein C0412_15025 [Flavobacterium sp.]|nr:hypothetical protein [Flavobacterium sp.]
MSLRGDLVMKQSCFIIPAKVGIYFINFVIVLFDSKKYAKTARDSKNLKNSLFSSLRIRTPFSRSRKRQLLRVLLDMRILSPIGIGDAQNKLLFLTIFYRCVQKKKDLFAPMLGLKDERIFSMCAKEKDFLSIFVYKNCYLFTVVC